MLHANKRNITYTNIMKYSTHKGVLMVTWVMLNNRVSIQSDDFQLQSSSMWKGNVIACTKPPLSIYVHCWSFMAYTSSPDRPKLVIHSSTASNRVYFKRLNYQITSVYCISCRSTRSNHMSIYSLHHWTHQFLS